jgi:hypothetical protein
MKERHDFQGGCCKSYRKFVRHAFIGLSGSFDRGNLILCWLRREILWQAVGVGDTFNLRSTQNRSCLMRNWIRGMSAGCLIAIGYILGVCHVYPLAHAQPEDFSVSDEATKKIVEANDALKKAVEQLKLESRYESVTKGVNPYSVLVGGINAKEDLESGHGVDPDTFAALNVAVYQLKKNNVKDESLADWVDTNLLGYDNNGHLTYRNKVVRIYSISRLRKLNAQRMVVLGETKEVKQSR